MHRVLFFRSCVLLFCSHSSLNWCNLWRTGNNFWIRFGIKVGLIWIKSNMLICWFVLCKVISWFLQYLIYIWKYLIIIVLWIRRTSVWLIRVLIIHNIKFNEWGKLDRMVEILRMAWLTELAWMDFLFRMFDCCYDFRILAINCTRVL